MKLLFISDLHLKAERPDITRAFLHFLTETASQADALYLLGDIFEAWIGDDIPLPEFEPIIAALKSLSDQGCQLYFQHGNRDFLVGDTFLQKIGASLIKEKPLLGHGTGSFEVEQKRLIKGTKTMKSDNPHNEYLLIGVQVGLVGVVLYLTLLGGLFGASFKKKRPYNFLLQGVVVAMFCGCLMNSFLFDSHQGHFFAIISAILISTQTKVSNSS